MHARYEEMTTFEVGVCAATSGPGAIHLLNGAFFLLFAIGTVASARSAPGPLGFDPADSVLHVIFMALNLAVLMWLGAETLEGPRWVRRSPAPDWTDPEDAP